MRIGSIIAQRMMAALSGNATPPMASRNLNLLALGSMDRRIAEQNSLAHRAIDNIPHPWENLSVPEHDPETAQELEYELRSQMRPADAFLIIAGLDAAH